MQSRPAAPCWVLPTPSSPPSVSLRVVISGAHLIAYVGSIRGDFALAVGRNIIHGSDSVESAEKEIKL